HAPRRASHSRCCLTQQRQQSSASQGGQRSAPPHSLPALGPLLPLSASRNMATSEEPPDPTEVHSKAVSTETEPPDPTEVHSKAVSTETEAPDLTEVHTEATSKRTGEPPDHRDMTKVTFHTNPELQVPKGAQQRNNAAVAVKTEPKDPTEVDTPAIFPGAGLGAAASKEFQQDLVPTNPIGSCAVVARPLQWIPTSVHNEVQPNAVYLHSVERHGIVIQPVVATLPVVAVLPERPDVVPPWLVGLGPGTASSQEVGQHRVLVDPTVAVRPPRHAPPAVCDGLRPLADVIKFREVERS
ncbi:hypothetical protein HPB47_012872, partial [Ixodes persulcatus]